jgi:DNA-binding transcriptional LysR family regulator
MFAAKIRTPPHNSERGVNMDIDYLKDFLLLAEIKNFQVTAEERFLSQPSLTRHIKLLEKAFETNIFDRTTRKIELNEYGWMLLPYAKEIVRLYDEFKNAVSNRQRSADNLLTIGSIPSMMTYNIPDVLEWTNLRYPFLEIHVVEETAAKLIELLKEERCDFAFIRRFKNNNDDPDNELDSFTLTNDVMVALVSNLHPLAKESHLPVSKFETVRLILPKGPMLYTKLLSAFDQAGFQPHIVFVSSRIEDIIDMARRNLGIAFALKSSLRFFSMDGISIYKLDPDFIMDINLVYLKSRKMTPPRAQFLESVNAWISEHS